jgi:hypothetical protein
LQSHVDLANKEPINLAELVASPHDNFFITGTFAGEKNGRNAGKPFNWIVDANGQIIRNVSLERDAAPKEALKSADIGGAHNSAVMFGRALLGDDGNLYLIRSQSPAVVYVIRESGELLRTVRVESPMTGSEPVGLLVHGGALAITFHDSESRSLGVIRVADAITGAPRSDYKLVYELGENVVCYKGNEFVFFGGTTIWRAIIHADIH